MAAVTRERLLIQANQAWEDIKTRIFMNEVRRGRLNNGGSLALTKDATSTTVSDDIVTRVSVIALTAEQTLGHDYKAAIPRATVLDHSFVVQHLSTSTSTVTFTYAVF